MKNLGHLPARFLKALLPCLATLCMARTVFAQPEPRTYYEGQVEPQLGANFSFAQYSCWLPTEPLETKGVLCIVLHPHGTAGVKFANPQPWLDLAARYRCALLSLSFVGAADQTKNWSHAFGGSGKALISAIDEVAAASGVTGLSKARIVVAGICQAGQFAYGFSAFAPERTAAFVTMGGSLHEVQFANQAAQVPGLLIAATDRGASGFDNMFSLFNEGRKHSAPWIFALESIRDYDQGNISALAEQFLNTTLKRLRQLSKNSPFTGRADNLQIPDDVNPFISKVNGGPTRLADYCVGGEVEQKFLGLNTANLFSEPNSYLGQSGLSFVSIPLPVLGHVEPERRDVGTLHLENPASERIELKYLVHCDPKETENVAVAMELGDSTWRAKRISEDAWQLSYGLDLNKLPTGTFNVEIPIRFVSKQKRMPGGIAAFISGRIVRDVSAQPSSVNFGILGASGGTRKLKLVSASGKEIEVVSVESSVPGSIEATASRASDGSVDITCSYKASANRDPVCGYFLMRLRSDREQTIKVLFYGQSAVQG